MADHKENHNIDPTQYSYCYTFGRHDCYKLQSGNCTFDLSEQEYIEAKEKCNKDEFYEGRVGYCREIYDSMMKDKAFSKSTGIRAYQNACGHITFGDGQHRSCIAKKKKVNELFLDCLLDNGDMLCSVCYQSEVYSKLPTLRKLLIKLSPSNKSGDILDDQI